MSLVPDDFPEWNINQAIVLFRPREGIFNRYLSFAFLTDSIMKRVTRLSKATAGQSNIGVSMCRHLLPVPLAPLSEQRRIVAKIEELFSDLEAGVAASRGRGRTSSVTASVLKAAVEGALTSEWRTQHPQVEPASKLLARILTERRRQWEADQLAKFAAAGKQPPNNWQAKYVEPSPPDTTNLPTLPDGWCWAVGAQLFGWSSGEFLPATNQAEGDVPVYGGNGITGHHNAHTIEMPTLVVGRVGVHCGNVHITKGRAWVTDNAIFASRLPAFCNIEFLSLCFHRANLNSQSQGGAQPFVNQRMLNEVVLPLPPVLEQNTIAAEFSEKLSQIESAELAIEHSLRRAARLRQSILKQAFEGKLVPQDPTDESASVLLARIRHERTDQVPTGTNRRTVGKRNGAKKVTIQRRRSLLDVLKDHPKGLSPEALLREAGYDITEVDDFYNELRSIASEIEEERPDGAKVHKWPKGAKILLRPKGE